MTPEQEALEILERSATSLRLQLASQRAAAQHVGDLDVEEMRGVQPFPTAEQPSLDEGGRSGYAAFLKALLGAAQNPSSGAGPNSSKYLILFLFSGKRARSATFRGRFWRLTL
jgi:hypothetical protein